MFLFGFCVKVSIGPFTPLLRGSANAKTIHWPIDSWVPIGRAVGDVQVLAEVEGDGRRDLL